MGKLYESVDGWERIQVNKNDTRFPSLQQGFNRRWIGENMESVYMVYTPQGAAQALDDAVMRYGCQTVRIMSGGHCYENFVYDEKTKAVINVSSLLDSGKNHRGYFLSSGDTNWGAFKKLFNSYGRVLPAGSCYSVGLGGHISGGGDGILSRLYGITVDSLTGIEVVVKPDLNKEAEVIYVSNESEDEAERDLFWAHTGGGPGNFGIITKYYFKELPLAPKGFVATYMHFDWDDIKSVDDLQRFLDWYFDFAEQSSWNTVGKCPIFHSAAKQFVLYIYSAYFNEGEKIELKKKHYELENYIDQNVLPIRNPKKALGSHGGWMPFPLRERKRHESLESFIADSAMEYPCYAMVQTMNGSGPNQRGKYKSAYMLDKLPRHQLETLFSYLTWVPPGLSESDMESSMVQFDTFGGKMNEVPPDATAIAQRGYNVKMQYQSYWQSRDYDSAHLEWINNIYNTMYAPYGRVPNPDYINPKTGKPLFQGCYYNYPDVGLNEWTGGKYGPGKLSALYLYFLDNLPRLVKTKAEWDPNEIFWSKQSIPPSFQSSKM